MQTSSQHFRIPLPAGDQAAASSSAETKILSPKETRLLQERLREAGEPLTIEQLLEALKSTRILDDKVLATVERDLLRVNRLQPAWPVVEQLVEQGLLTQYQSSLLLKGLTGGLVYGDYVVQSRIAQGGMSKVFLARCRRTGREVALKVVPDHDARFVREIRAVSRLSHPNIVHVYDHGRDHGAEYLAMEYIDGPNLSAYVQQNGPLSPEVAVELMIEASQAVAHVHAQRIVHRDVKPHNFLLDPAGKVRLVDLGLARFDDLPASFSVHNVEQMTGAGMILGTPAFMSPEQIRDSRSADYRADIYSLGCMLYFLLAGKGPYSRGNPMQTFEAHLTQPIPSIREVRPDVPRELDGVFVRMVAKNPQDRYQSIDQLLGDLHRVLQRIKEPPPPAPAPVSRKPVIVSIDDGREVLRDPTLRYELMLLVGWTLLGGLVALMLYFLR